MGEPLQKLTMMGENIQPQSSSSDDVVEISLISSEDDKQESSSIQEINTPNAKNNSETFTKVDPCLLCAQPAVEYDGEGKPILNQKGREQAPLYNYSRLFGFLCKGLSLKPIYGMVKGDWNFNSMGSTAPFPFCGRCESLINNLAGVYTRLEAIKTELKDRMEEGEEIYMREELYSKQNVRYYNFRKLVLGAKFQGTVKGRMFQRNHPQSTSGLTRPTCFDESMFPPNHPGSQSLLKTTNADAEANGSSSSSSSSSPAVPPPPSPRKKWKGATSRIPPVASLSQGSSSTTNSLKPAGIGATFDPTRFHRFSKRKPPVPSTLKRNPPNLTPVYIPDTSGFMERCPDSGKITYYSSGATKKARQILSFTPTPQNDQYQCTECRELVPFLHVRKIQQQQLFRHHFLKFHTDCWRCKMCKGDGGEDKDTNGPMDKEELVAHLESQHGITDWGDYLQLSQLHGNNNKNTPEKIECQQQPLL